MNLCYFCRLTFIYTIKQKKVNNKMKVFFEKNNENQRKAVILCLNENEKLHIDDTIMLGTNNY